ncbi:winged helix-turn-helix domain-containing protein [Nocardiopsis dassonvillei]|uniref:winged helix-turn-helix domain-containing protein n=1 Tax=Nocardiopsis dassonvillei TaxID=2014 RepID=UPI00362C8E95
MVRIHFTGTDLANTVVAPEPDPMWETLLSLHALQNRDGRRVFDPWRRSLRQAPPSSLHQVLPFGPARGYSPDFLTPAVPLCDMEEGIEALARTPRARLRGDLEILGSSRRLPGWSDDLARGRTSALRRLTEALRDYHGRALAPHWDAVRRHVHTDRALRARALLQGGVEALLAGLSPALAWQSPVLELRSLLTDRDLYLDGRGLRLIPSFFCWRVPILLRDSALSPVLVYPVDHDSVDGGWFSGRGEGSADGSLRELLGRTRADILRTVADHGRSTTQVARDVGVSAATASQHLSVLRGNGLLTTHRLGPSVHHTATPLGRTLCGG